MGPEKFQRTTSQGRRYVWPMEPPHELTVPSVTTILGKGIPKEALMYWAAKIAAEYAVRHKASWESLPTADAVDLIKRAHSRHSRERMDAGSALHDALENFSKGEADAGADLPKELMGYYQGALQFLEECEVEPAHVEGTVFSRTHGYAGTADIIGTLRTPLRAERVAAVIDFKTGKAIYPDMGLQLTAYARADFVGLHDGTEAPMLDLGTTYIVRPKARGGYEAQEFIPTDASLDLFLAAKVVAERDRTLREQMGETINSKPPKKEA